MANDDDERELAARRQLEEAVRAIGQELKATLAELFGPDRVGFLLMLGDLGEAGSLAYTASIERTDAINLCREWLDKVDPRPRAKA